MPEKISRRNMLHKGAQAAIAGTVATCATPILKAAESPATPPPAQGVDYYQKLGVATFINAAGTYTVLSASTMPDEVQAAIALASQHPVNLIELQNAAGAYLANRLKCGGAIVTSGAAGALTVGTAACVTLGNKDAILNIPTDMASLKNEIIVQKTHRYDYDHALRNCGTRLRGSRNPRRLRESLQRQNRYVPLLQRC